MKTTVFAKKVKTNDGKSFFIFVTSLEKKDGSKQYMNVMYSGDDKNKKFDSCMKRAFPEKYGFRKEKINQMKFYIMLSSIKQRILKVFKRI